MLWQHYKHVKTNVYEWGLTWYLRWEIYTSTWTHSQDSATAVVAWNLWEYLLAAQGLGTSSFFKGKSIVTETTTWSQFSNGGKATEEQILGSEERKKYSKEQCCDSHSQGIRVGKLNIWVRLFEIKKSCNRGHQVYQFHQNKLTSPYDGH